MGVGKRRQGEPYQQRDREDREEIGVGELRAAEQPDEEVHDAVQARTDRPPESRVKRLCVSVECQFRREEGGRHGGLIGILHLGEGVVVSVLSVWTELPRSPTPNSSLTKSR